MAPPFDLVRGLKIVNDSEGNKLSLDIAGWPENAALDAEHSLQLCNTDRNPPKPSKEEPAATA